MHKTRRPTLDDADLPTPGRQRRRLCRAAAGLLLGGLNLGLAGCGGGAADAPGVSPSDIDEQRLPLGGVDSGGTGSAMSTFVSADIGTTWPLTVNGIEYDTSGCRIVDADDQPLDALALLPGMSCQIQAIGPRGRASSALARQIRVGEQLLGSLATLDLAASSFTALGQRVVVTAGTLFDAALAGGLLALRAGQVLQVWGQLDSAGGRIVATRVGLAAPANTRVVRGVLTGLDRSSGRIRIAGLQAATAPGEALLIPSGLRVGDVVRARLSPEDGQAGLLLSLRGDALQLPDRVEAELEGRITRIDTVRRFAVDGVSVDATAAKLAPAAALLVLGARVAVHGRSVQGQLLAATLRVEPDEPVELEGTITAADAARQTFVLRGVTVAWTASTVFEGGSARLLRVRRRVAVIGRWNASRSVLEAQHLHVEA